MAGLPCEACQESMTVIPLAAVVTDAADRTVYRRYRTCTNPGCDLYLIRRSTFEVVAPLRGSLVLLTPALSNLKSLHLKPRTSPLPEWLFDQSTD